ncbi:hypothetical protein PISL3812_03959 [Talaromyces islandicus]|uniref:Uncharacterized protein n=1 Tax=Talaromyces islandicus TaxID=28573 RepID=A0A0U1LVX6_TALIS|nr:hypothetical protein PISL3812_03959 [Talaromyces islandicus]
MRMILAIAASDMHRRGLVPDSSGKGSSKNPGRYHYEAAVQEFRQYLEEHGAIGKTQEGFAAGSDCEIIFCTMFLMVLYEWYYGHSVKHLQLHLQGVRCLLKARPKMFTTKGMTDAILSTGSIPNQGLSFMPAQLLLWILYMEISGHPRGLNGSLYDTLLDSGNPALHPDYLHQCARIWGRCLWGDEYPETQILDDMENHRALELLHHAFIMKNKIWQLALGKSPRSTEITPDSLYLEMITIRERYSDMFITAKLATSLSSRRVLYTIYFAVCAFETQILYHQRILYPTSRARNMIHRQAVANLLDILYKQYSGDPKLLQRIPYSLFLVMIETDDPIHRDWAAERLRELRNLDEGYSFINSLADDFVERQQMYPGEMVDLSDILLTRHDTCNSG